MNILLATDFYPPDLGGVELQVQALARELQANGHVVTVLTIGSRRSDATGDDGVRVIRVSGLFTSLPSRRASSRRYPWPIPDPLIVRAVRRHVAAIRPDIAQVHGWIASSVAVALRGSSTALVTSVRDYGYACAVRTLLERRQRVCSGPSPVKCLRCACVTYGAAKGVVATVGVAMSRPILARESDAFHVVSRATERATRRDVLGAHPTPITRIPDIVLTAEPQAEPIHGLPDEPFLLYVGALQPHKGIELLLDAWAGADLPPLVCVGTVWPDTPATWPPGVRVAADVDHATVIATMDRCLAGVVPSRWPDPLPGVVREFMARGKPVVGASVGGIPDMIEDGETGILVPPDDVIALREALTRVSRDGVLRDRLGRAAASEAARYDPSHVVPAFVELYGSVTAAAGRPGGVDLSSARRIVVTGGIGQGKTTLARIVATARSVPFLSLDDAATEAIEQIRRADAWVVEGVHLRAAAALYEDADLVVWLDAAPPRTAAGRVVLRFIRGAATAFRARRGLDRFRPRAWMRELAGLARVIVSISRFEAAGGGADGHARAETERFLTNYREKVVRCGNPRAVRRLRAALASR